MRERITFLHRADKAPEPSQLQVKGKKLYIKELHAAREDVLTLSLAELSKELSSALTECHRVHLRWVSPYPYESIAPYASRLPPGLHIFSTPQAKRSARPLCSIVKGFFGQDLECSDDEAAFTDLGISGQRFTSSAAFQYHQILPSLDKFSQAFAHRFCKGQDRSCSSRKDLLKHVDYLDIDFDAVSAAIHVKTFWSKCPIDKAWSLTIDGDKTDVEVGVLTNEKPTSEAELSLGGSLIVVGKDSKPSTTLFSFPARHHLIEPTFTFRASIPPPSGLHPTLRLTFPFLPSDPTKQCTLCAYLTLPSTLFLDRYQFIDPLFLSSKNILRIRALRGETDLEAPKWATPKWGSSVLVEIQKPLATEVEGGVGEWNVDIPLHLRYLSPTSGTDGIVSVEQPWPAVFWACFAEDGTKMASSPFDRVDVGYDALFGPKSVFYHVSPQPGNGNASLVEQIRVPVLDLQRAEWVGAGTVLAIFLGLAATLLVLGRAAGRTYRRSSAGVVGKEKKVK